MIRLNVGLCRKVTDRNYGSKGGNVNLEVEVDSSLTGDPFKLREHIHCLFGMVRKALEEELQGNDGGELEEVKDHKHQGSFTGNEAGSPVLNNSVRLASEKQLSLIQGLLRKGKMPFQPLLDERKINGFNELTVQQASGLITQLKARVG